MNERKQKSGFGKVNRDDARQRARGRRGRASDPMLILKMMR